MGRAGGGFSSRIAAGLSRGQADNDHDFVAKAPV